MFRPEIVPPVLLLQSDELDKVQWVGWELAPLKVYVEVFIALGVLNGVAHVMDMD